MLAQLDPGDDDGLAVERAKGQRILDIAGIVQLAGRMLHRIGDERTAKAMRDVTTAGECLHRLGTAIRHGEARVNV